MTPCHGAGTTAIILTTAVGLAALLALSPPASAQETEDPLAQARKQMKNLRYERAFKQVNRVLEEDPGNLEGWKLRAEISLRMANLEEALVSYERASAIVPEDRELLIHIGDLLRRYNNRLDEALETYRRALAQSPDDTGLMVDMGSIHERRHEWAEASAMYRAALALDPNLVRARSSLGAVLFKQGDYPGASENLRKAIELSPRDLRSKVFLGLSQNHLGNYDRALEEFKEALRIDPHSANQLIGVQEQRSQFMALVELFQRAYEEAPREAGRSYDLAVIHYYAHDYESAWEHLVRAEKLRYPIPIEFKEVIYSRRRLRSSE